MSQHVYLADPDYVAQLHTELADWGRLEQLDDRLFLLSGPARPSAWAVCIWFEVERLPISSIGKAAALLRERGPYWDLHVSAAARRSRLVADKLLRIRDKTWEFPLTWQPKPRGAFTLLSETELLCATRTSRILADGRMPFVEDKQQPPSRAYLKLWEALALLGERPQPGEHCLELGAAPGAWTWTLAAKCGAQVTSIDKAPLDPAIAILPGVTHRQGSAFAIAPQQDPADWLFSDVICYPERLQHLLQRWLDGGGCRRGVLTIKFQGETDFAALREFAQVPGVRLLHLSHNKHEITVLLHPKLSGDWPRPWPY
jgi:23S rRNA (cytidine2498-2'-O)-methyltransferase